MEKDELLSLYPTPHIHSAGGGSLGGYSLRIKEVFDNHTVVLFKGEFLSNLSLISLFYLS